MTYQLPDPDLAAEVRAEFAVTPAMRIHPDQIAPQVVTADDLPARYAEWLEDFIAPAVWCRHVLTWDSGAVFTSGWELVDYPQETR